MEWVEVDRLPVECVNCQEADCYNCDHAGKRWQPAKEDRLLLRRKVLVTAKARLQRQIEEIDRELRGNRE